MAQSVLPPRLAALAAKGKALNQAAVGGITSFQLPPHISILNNRFTVVNGKGDEFALPSLEIEVIVVGVNPNTSHIFYDPKDEYDPKAKERKPPLCSSDNGIGPSIRSGSPQNLTCQGCPMAEWGAATSKQSGKGVPACREYKKLAVLFNNFAYGDGEDHYELLMLGVPPNSLKNWQNYVKFVDSHPDGSLNVIRTKIGFDKKIIGTLTFGAIDWLTDEDTIVKVESITDDLWEDMVGMDDKPITTFNGAARAIAAPKAEPTPTPAPKPKVIAPPKESAFDPYYEEKEQAQLQADKEYAEYLAAKKSAAKAQDYPNGAPEPLVPRRNGKAEKKPSFGMVEATQTDDDPAVEEALERALNWKV